MTGPFLPALPGTATESPLTLYCSPSGDDANPGTALLPLRQPQAALERIPGKRVRHLVKVECAPGTYAGFHVSGLTFDPLPDGTTCGLHVYGTLADAVPATGTALGTVTAFTPAVVASCSFAVVSDGTQTWTADDLKGRYLVLLTGTGAGQVYPIISNTATDVVVPAIATIAAPGTTYAIRSPASVITTPVQLPGGIAGATGNPPPGLILNSGIIVSGSIGPNRTGWVRLEQFAVELDGAQASWSDLLVLGGNVLVRLERSTLRSAAGRCVDASGGVLLSLASCHLYRPVASVMVSAGGSANAIGPANLNMTGVYVQGLGNAGMGLGIGSGASGSVANCQFDTDTMISIAGPCWLQFGGITKKTWTSNHNFGIRSRIASSGPGGAVLHLIGNAAMEISACGASAAVWLEGTHTFMAEGTLIGSGNLEGIRLGQGARMKFGVTGTLTGTTDIVYDGVTSTLANFRAQHLLNNGYGTAIFE